MDLSPGIYQAQPADDTMVRLVTQRIGLMTLDVRAPVVAGQLDVGDQQALRVELALNDLRTGNPLMQTAARALVHSGNGDVLVFHAAASLHDAWEFAGTARAGDVEVPMRVKIEPQNDGGALQLDVKGWARFDDVHIPLPGLSHIRTIEADVSGTIPFALGG